jgi:hypothetical protein
MSCRLSPERERVILLLDGSPEYTVKESGVKQKMSLRHFSGYFSTEPSYLKGIDRDRRSGLRFKAGYRCVTTQFSAMDGVSATTRGV